MGSKEAIVKETIAFFVKYNKIDREILLYESGYGLFRLVKGKHDKKSCVGQAI